jgi:hypothetical protein
MCLCVRGTSTKPGMTAHFPSFVLVPLTHIQMTAHFPGFVLVPLAHIHMTAYHPGLVLVPLTRQESKQSCVCVLGYQYQARKVSSHVYVC